jgi:hypothetical protein
MRAADKETCKDRETRMEKRERERERERRRKRESERMTGARGRAHNEPFSQQRCQRWWIELWYKLDKRDIFDLQLV